MFDFLKKKATVPALITDIHSHLIPGIDDGAQSIEESLTLLRALQELGYTQVITTPHIMFDAYGNTKTSIREGLQILQNVAQKQDIHLQIDAAAEYYLDEGLLPLIQKKDLLLIDQKYLLFETSYTHRPQQLEEIIFEILAAGYIPLLAHPERYRYIEEISEFQTIKDLGVEFQVNINSFNGYYGSTAQKNALALSQQGLINFLGSDTHNIKQVENLSLVFKSKAYKEIYVNNTIKNQFLTVS